MSISLPARPLSRELFAAFGDVIDTEGSRHYTINAGWAERYHDLAALDLTEQSGRPTLSIFRARPRPEPVVLELMERHSLSSQTFVPLTDTPFLVVVAAAGTAPRRAEDLFAFITNGRQGVSYRRGVWHHPLLAVVGVSDFLVVDRVGLSEDCDEVPIADWGVSITPG